MVKIPNGDGDESTLYWGKIWTVIFTDAIESQCNIYSIRGYTVISLSEAWWKPDLCSALIYVVQYGIIQI